MKIPTQPFSLMKLVYKKVFPLVYQELDYWKKRAEAIPDLELRKQALASIDTKTFHCEGGSILALLAQENMEESIKFIVAYQTISDYLDNLCDRSTSLDPVDFRALHDSMLTALDVDKEQENYYRYRSEQEDGGYLFELVDTCQSVLKQNEHYDLIKAYLIELAQYYCDLQVHKHVKEEERLPRLQTWFNNHKQSLPPMEWYEFSACSGSTLGIFCLVSNSFQSSFTNSCAEKIVGGYFPYIQGLHILLDYFIDQDEDMEGGDLNFCFYYPNEKKILERLQHFLEKADEYTKGLPHEKFHKLINRGLLAVYLSDEKVQGNKDISTIARKMIRSSGGTGYFFYINGRVYRTVQKWKRSS